MFTLLCFVAIAFVSHSSNLVLYFRKKRKIHLLIIIIIILMTQDESKQICLTHVQLVAPSQAPVRTGSALIPHQLIAQVESPVVCSNCFLLC